MGIATRRPAWPRASARALPPRKFLILYRTNRPDPPVCLMERRDEARHRDSGNHEARGDRDPLRGPTQEALNYLDVFALRVPRLRGARSLLFVRAEVGSVGEVMGKVSRIYVASIPQ
jgi:hypothetical protein